MMMVKSSFVEKDNANDSSGIIGNPYFDQQMGTFDTYLSDAHKRYWNPKDSAYLDLSKPFNLTQDVLLPISDFPEFLGPLGSILDDKQKAIYINTYAAKMITGMLYAEQTATFGCVNLSKMVSNFSAVEYALNQAREEARHISGFYQYIQSRFKEPTPIRSIYKDLLNKITHAPRVHLQIIGVQVILEGLGMSTLSYFSRHSNDPALQRLCRLVMSDEASHHKFGIDWLQQLDHLSKVDREEAEDWAWYCFSQFRESTFAPNKIINFYQGLGFSEHEASKITNQYHLGEQTASAQMFYQLAKILNKNGLITQRTRHHYSQWLDTTVEDETKINQQIITEAVTLLEGINVTRKSRHVVDIED